MSETVLIDLSSIAHPIWHMVQADPDVNRCSTQIVARVRALATGNDRVAVCCDSGKSFRKDINASYKANRPERDEALHHQIDLAKEILLADGFPVWSAPGFEADDLIATATVRALETSEDPVLIVSSDKDLLQLVGPRVTAKSVQSGNIIDEAGVVAKFGVPPNQMQDFLTLVGDSSDNVVGAKGIGPKKAMSILFLHGSLDALYEKFEKSGPTDLGLKPSEYASIEEFASRWRVVRLLIALRTDVEIPFEELNKPRVPKDAETFGEETMSDETEPVDTETAPLFAEPEAAAPAVESEPVPSGHGTSAPTALAVREPDVLAPAPAEWERQLDPRSMQEARNLAKDMFSSRMFSAYGSPQAVLSTVMVGRELGLPAMASLRGVHVIEGKHSLSASLIVALVLKSGLAEYFDPISFSETEATFETKRVGGRAPIKLTHTIEMAKAAGLVKEKSGWLKNPTDMLVARAQARLARMVYPDLLAGLYTPEELADMHGGVNG